MLGFVGLKMVADFGGVHVSTTASLAVVVGLLGAGAALSLAKKGDDDEEERGRGRETLVIPVISPCVYVSVRTRSSCASSFVL